MTVSPYSLVAKYQPISVFRIEERRIKLIRNASRSICQTTRCHRENHNSHNAYPALKSTGKVPTARLLALQNDRIPAAPFCSANGTGTRGQNMHKQNAELLSALHLQGISPCNDGFRSPALQKLRKIFSSKRS